MEELGGKALSDQAAAAKSSSEMLLNRANQVLEDVRSKNVRLDCDFLGVLRISHFRF